MKQQLSDIKRLLWMLPSLGMKAPVSKLMLFLLLSVTSGYGQVYYPPKNIPIDPPAYLHGRDTVYGDSLNNFLSGVGPWVSAPKHTIVQSLYPSFTSVPNITDSIWRALKYCGLTLDLDIEAYDTSYLFSFAPGTLLMRQTFTLKLYAPGDTVMSTPVYQDDSVRVELQGGMTGFHMKIVLDSVVGRYIPPEGIKGFRPDPSNWYVDSILAAVTNAIYAGTDSVYVGNTLVSNEEALRLADSAEFAFRGVAIANSLHYNHSIGYELIPNLGTSYLNPGFNQSKMRVGITLDVSVLSHPASASGTGVGTGIGSGPGVRWITDPGSHVSWPTGTTGWPCSPAIPLAADGVILSNPITYKWVDCPPAVNYQIQILRLYNTNPLPPYSTNEHYVDAKIDWSQALELETNNGQQSIRLTTAEGSGYYVWRVRQVHDLHPNTIGNDLNWGPWSSTGPFINGVTVPIDPSMLTAHSKYLFYYDVFNDSVNWIYHRQFVEGEIDHGSQLRIGEKTTFANYLLMPVQEQVRTQEPDTIVASQTIPDHSGRPVFQTLAAPIGKEGFDYEYNYIKNPGDSLYSANDYDLLANFLVPRKVIGTSKLVKYYSNINGDVQIPNCDSLPFTRTLNYNDGLNRPREIASPGKYHNFQSNHSVKKYYCSATATELIRIFGDEAPKSNSILKTYTVDPNGVYNVSYTDEITGKVLATCLSTPQSPLLDSLPGSVFLVRDTVSAKTSSFHPSKLVETKTYTFAVPTLMSRLYRIVPKIYGDTCLSICANCDYVVYLSAYNIDDSDASHAYRDTIIISPGIDSVSGSCSTFTTSDSAIYSIIPIGGTTPGLVLDPGTYVTTATIMLANSDPVAGNSYIAEVDSIMLRKLRNNLWTSLGYVIGGASGVNLTTIQGYLNAVDVDGLLAYTGCDTSQPYFKLVVGCDTLTLPTAHCKKHDCSTIDFSEYLVSELAQYDVDHGTVTFSGLTDISATTHADNLFLVGSNSEFNTIIGSMISDGYSCDTLWNAWVETVGWFASVMSTTVTGTMGTSTPKADWWQHFMEKVGYKFPFLPQAYVQLSTTGSNVRLYPYKYYPYDFGSNPGAEDMFCYMYETIIGYTITGPYVCAHPSTSATTGWMAAIHNFTAYAATDTFHMYSFYRAIKPSSSVYVGMLGSPPLPGFTGGVPSSSYATMEADCKAMCESRRSHFVGEIAHEYMLSGYTVAGYTYSTPAPYSIVPPIGSVDMPRVSCMAATLVNHCKEGCTLTPNPTTGVVSSSQMAAFTRSMMYSMAVKVSPLDSPDCSSIPVTHDTTVTVLRDSVFCYTSPHGMQCDTIKLHIDSTYSILDYYDSSYTTICNADTNYADEIAMIDWINNRYSHIYDSLVSAISLVPFSWDPMAAHGVNSFASWNPGCLLSPIFIYPGSPKGRFCYDTIRKTTTTCSGSTNFNVYRRFVRHAFVSSSIDVEVDVVPTTGGAVLLNDSLVVKENFPSAGTILWSNAPIVGGSAMHLRSVGPISVGDTLKLRYRLLMPPTSGTDVIYSGTVVRYTAPSTTASCSIAPDTTSADTCVRMYYVVPGRQNAISLCDICHTPLGCNVCICARWDPPGTPPGDSVHSISCAEFVTNTFSMSLASQMQQIADRHSAKLRQMYDEKCSRPDSVNDLFVNYFELNQYQYTLYYYDRAGNLIRTCSPRGVRDTGTGRFESTPRHYDQTVYEYNTLGQMLRQQSPDGGQTVFWYDKRGKVRLSQNDKQVADDAYSYTKYDELARVIESGEIFSYAAVLLTDIDDAGFPYDGAIGYQKRFITRTYYSIPCPISLPDWGTVSQRHLQNRISYTETERDPVVVSMGPDDKVWTIYSYDAHGNAEKIISYISGAANAVQLEYRYDVVSNKVVRMRQNKLHSSPGILEEDFTEHKYSYDGDKRLKSAGDSYAPGLSGWVGSNAYYTYYLHGPLRRMHLGNVGGIHQAVDYTYTLQGWLKGINHSKLWASFDPGQDTVGLGISGTGVPHDIYGMVLNYYKGDFNRIGSRLNSVGNSPYQLEPWDSTSQGGHSLYNGNIRSWTNNVQPIPSFTPTPTAYFEQENGYTYRYDQLNRIKKARFWIYDNSAPPSVDYWRRAVGDGLQPYDEDFTYDRNGNITSLLRTAYDGTIASGFVTDDLTYSYTNANNQLNSVTESVSPATSVGDVAGTGYAYDEIGQLKDETASAENYKLHMHWTPYGKVDTVVRMDASGTLIDYHTYLYDAMGNQVYDKLVDGSGYTVSEEFHIYDGSNVKVAEYYTPTSSYSYMSNMHVKERYLYGSERLGTIKGPNVVSTWSTSPAVIDRAWDTYHELHDHLGNVRAIFSAIPPVMYSDGTTSVRTVGYYNYYAFGSMHPNRHYEPSIVNTFGFNGKEKKDDWRVAGGSYDYGARNYDARIGRWISADPLRALYPDATPYGFALNTPIQSKDPDGRIVIFVNGFYVASSLKDYWEGGDEKFMRHFGDPKSRYYDGSLGGLTRLVTMNDNSSEVVRMAAGEARGKADAASIIAGLSRDANDPNHIIESIKVVTHSMGTAYARGYTNALVQYVNDYNSSHSNKLSGFEIETEVDIAAFQGSYLPAPKYITNRFYMVGDKDWLANGTASPGSAVVPNAQNIVTKHGTRHNLKDYIKDEYLDQLPRSSKNPVGLKLPHISLNIHMPSIHINVNVQEIYQMFKEYIIKELSHWTGKDGGLERK